MEDKDYGLVKVAAACLKMAVANPEYNITEIEKVIKKVDKDDVSLAVFPELCITGYTCGDLFNQRLLIEKSLSSLQKLMDNTKEMEVVSIVGMPILLKDKLYNCGVVFQKGRILGVVPKMYPPNYKEFYEKRWFVSGEAISKKVSEINLLEQKVPFGNLVFRNKQNNFTFGVEICEDLWTVIPPSSYLALNGAKVIANLSASNELVGKNKYRKSLVVNQSASAICGYVYSSAGVHESTTDTVFGGDCIIAENGSVVNVGERFKRDNSITYGVIDVEKISSERQINTSFENYLDKNNVECKDVEFNYNKSFDIEKFDLNINAHPFVPKENAELNDRCDEIFNIQVAGLAKRLESTGIKKAVVGISGGLDSTLALLVMAKTFDILNIPRENIFGITMPGFGTTNETYNNALDLMKSLNITMKEIDIKPACLQHFIDIKHDKDIHDVTYENVQARERTQILMDYANKNGGLVVGTGDLSELILGWCTYNGDQMSMYGVNAGVPKTLVRFLVKWVAENQVDKNTSEVLSKIVDTPISPELLPPDKDGKIAQKTENTIGPYELHDFFIFNSQRNNFEPKKILFLAKKAFKDIYTEEEITKWLKVFYRRLFTQQFKRSAMPDGPKVGSVGVSPRADLRMPSDADGSAWLMEL